MSQPASPSPKLWRAILSPGSIKAISFILVLAVVIGVLREVKTKQEAQRRAAFSPSRVPWVEGTTDHALQAAIIADDGRAVARLLRQVPSSALRPDMVPRLSKDKRVHALEAFLQAGWSPNGLSGNGTPLLTAVQMRQLKAVEVLLRHGANPNVRGERRAPALLIACFPGAALPEENYLPMIKLLLDHGADPNLSSDELFPDVEKLRNGRSQMIYLPFKRRPIDSILARGDPEALDLILQHGADPNGIKWGPNPPVFSAVWRPKGPQLARMLLDKGALVDPMCTFGLANANGPSTMISATPLFACVKKDNLEVAKVLLAHGANPLYPCSGGIRPIDIAKGEMLKLMKQSMSRPRS